MISSCIVSHAKLEKWGVNQYPDAVNNPTVTEILKGSEYALTIFTEAEIKALKIFDKGGKPYVTCAGSDKPRPAKPEEMVRQLYLRKLIDHYGYPTERIAIEKPVYFGSAVHEKAADIVVWEKNAPTTPYIIVEIKRPRRKDQVRGLIERLGYPLYFLVSLGIWKLLGAVALIIPGFPRLKEWAYAGVFFDLTGAVSSQLASGLIDAGTMAYPIVMTGVAVASWALRPPSRRLDPG